MIGVPVNWLMWELFSCVSCACCHYIENTSDLGAVYPNPPFLRGVISLQPVLATTFEVHRRGTISQRSAESTKASLGERYNGRDILMSTTYSMKLNNADFKEVKLKGERCSYYFPVISGLGCISGQTWGTHWMCPRVLFLAHIWTVTFQPWKALLIEKLPCICHLYPLRYFSSVQKRLTNGTSDSHAL